jgi:DNA-binding FrmR family transcriptional regulator
MDDALPILEYLPNSFREPGEQEYINFLWDAFASNYENENYQFAMLPYHMLYMSFVYFSVWQIKLMLPKDFENASIFVPQREREILQATSPFTFSVVNERSIFRFLKLIGCEDQHTGSFARLVDVRNELAHSNGLITCRDQVSADQRVGDVMRQVRAIQAHMTPLLHECLSQFLTESCASDEGMEYDNPEDQIREVLVHKHYFSLKDIEACRRFDIHALATQPRFEAKRELFEQFLSIYPAEALE